ncbi:MAG: PhoPQ-activated protein PqaA family protein [Pirellulaceae bacterium]
MSNFQHLARLTLVLASLFPICASGQETPAGSSEQIPDALAKYVAATDSTYQWTLDNSASTALGKTYQVSLTSQKWQGIDWQHALLICEPLVVKYPKHVLLYVNGGRNGRKPKEDDAKRGLLLANLCGARVAVIHQVPNQPLLGDHYEDDLITETWLKYLETGDETWPLLFPMVKSAVRAMDAVQEISVQHWDHKVESFVITGASKRGWTSWLTPVVEKRVIATAPVVIDVLNFRPQMQHQIESWGKYSEQIIDYTSKGLIVTGDEAPREKQLRVMMDPYTYREQLALPKYLVNGTNDPYWVVDAMRWYWDDLQGPKYVLQVPNAGHNLGGGVEYALSSIAAFFQHMASATPLPQIDWTHTFDANQMTLTAKSSETPIEVYLWSADSDDKDFRDERWTSKRLTSANNEFRATVSKSENGHIANYIELKYEINQVPYSLCTLIYRD